YHSGFVLELEKSILIFDFYRIPTDKKNEEESFISKFIKRTDKKIYVFSSHSHSDHFNKEILKWLNLNENIKYILSDDIKIHKHKNFYFTKEGDSFELDNLKISTFGSTDLGSSFYVNVEDKNIFHSGDLHLWHWEDDTLEEEKTMYDAYMSELEKIKKLDRIDIAFVPVDPRLGVNTLEGVELFYKVLKPKLIVPMHFSDDYSQIKNFIEAFKNIKDVEVIEIDESMKKILE
ncbi:MAG: MBL fold metallo-hydrolase, partial [Fusobacterium periodonticum]|nr:MBL fold metallo-hydrolase [Fusobacterium periodonticum]